MKRSIILIAGSSLLLILSCQTKTMNRKPYIWPPGVTAPIAEQKPRTFVQHGDTIVDEYFWMNDFFKKGPDSTQVVDYLKAENAYLDTMMSGTKQFQTHLIAEMRGRIQEKDESVPVTENGYSYYTKTREGKQYYQYYRKALAPDAVEATING